MAPRILITGGAGFIGSHLADELLAGGHEVRVLDSLIAQVHGPARARPSYLDPAVDLEVGDVRDGNAVRRALRGVDAVFHLAALVGVGQSMYRIADYTSVNNLGTATLLEALIEHPVARLVVASSMSIYGEGLYRDHRGAVHTHVRRAPEELSRQRWEPLDERCRELVPMPTRETKPPCLSSIYALSKYDQERMCLTVGQAYGIPAVALRFFNVFGPRQALSNPYTGVLAIFAARYLHDKAPVLFEDGHQTRDFVHVRDVARACCLALSAPGAVGGVYNVGSGRALRILDVALQMGAVLGKQHIVPEITAQHRVGDIRHCFADIQLARKVLGYEPGVGFEKGLVELAQWLGTHRAHADDLVDQARAELAARGLTL